MKHIKILTLIILLGLFLHSNSQTRVVTDKPLSSLVEKDSSGQVKLTKYAIKQLERKARTEKGNQTSINISESIIGATNKINVASSNAVSSYMDVVADQRDGIVYATTVIKNNGITMKWMAQNLAYTNGNTIGKWFKNDSLSFRALYGRFYTWYEAMGGTSSECKGCINTTGENGNDVIAVNSGQGICPEGWRIPTGSDWAWLANANLKMHGETETAVPNKTHYTAGKLLKTADCGGWAPTNNYSEGTNLLKWYAVPGGNYYDNSWNNASKYGYWWSATERSSANAYYMYLQNYEPLMGSGLNFDKSAVMFNVRCVQ